MPMKRSRKEIKETSQKKRESYQRALNTGFYANGRPVQEKDRKRIKAMASHKTNFGPGRTRVPASNATARAYDASVCEAEQRMSDAFLRKHRKQTAPLSACLHLRTVS